MESNINPQISKNSLVSLLESFSTNMAILFVFILALRIYEFTGSRFNIGLKDNLVPVFRTALCFDLCFYSTFGVFLLVASCLMNYIAPKISRILLVLVPVVICVCHLLLVKYFSVALNPLGADAYHYSFGEIKQTLSAAISVWGIASLLLSVSVIIAAFVYIPRYKRVTSNFSVGLPILCILFFVFGISKSMVVSDFGSEYNNNLLTNKSSYFYAASFDYFFHSGNNSDISLDAKYSDGKIENDFTYKDPGKYAFMHVDSTKDVFSSYIRKSETAPDYVFIIVEGLGRAFSNENSYLQSFTPFLDSLSRHSLYWENCLSTAGRTFEALPSILGSLPYGSNGFAESGNQMPSHLSLMRILADNGYQSSFYYGGDSKFDNMNLFLKQQKISHIYDQYNFNSSYKKLPSNSTASSWGYGDSELFRFYLSNLDQQPKNKPRVSVLLTLATHNPFLVNDQERYNALFEKRMQELKLDASSVKQHREYKPQYASILYADDALRCFFRNYSLKPSFKNTIFIITGDHRMPDIPISTKIDRYHVPLIVYSPLLKQASKFPAVVSHLDISPTILAFQKKQYHIKAPSLVSWLGAGLDTAHFFRNRNNYPLMQTKEGVNEYISGDYMLSAGKVFKLSENMGLKPVKDAMQSDKLQRLLNQFILRNKEMIDQKTLLPENLLKQY
ncbi:MAG: LTA synthase family protein [Bacteroidota bacterium]|nr:LTA synthase family protein [Bacteroidota bacterium]